MGDLIHSNSLVFWKFSQNEQTKQVKQTKVQETVPILIVHKIIHLLSDQKFILVYVSVQRYSFTNNVRYDIIFGQSTVK